MKLLVLDGNSIVNRAFYGIKLLSTKDGLFTNGIYGFMTMLQKLKDEIKTSKRTFTAQEYFDKFGGLCPDCATADYAARRNKGEGE